MIITKMAAFIDGHPGNQTIGNGGGLAATGVAGIYYGYPYLEEWLKPEYSKKIKDVVMMRGTRFPIRWAYPL